MYILVRRSASKEMVTMQKITEEAVLELLGVVPKSQTEIAEHFGVHRGSPKVYLDRLIAKGLVERKVEGWVKATQHVVSEQKVTEPENRITKTGCKISHPFTPKPEWCDPDFVEVIEVLPEHIYVGNRAKKSFCFDILTQDGEPFQCGIDCLDGHDTHICDCLKFFAHCVFLLYNEKGVAYDFSAIFPSMKEPIESYRTANFNFNSVRLRIPTKEWEALIESHFR
jgi:hypothetical protein